MQMANNPLYKHAVAVYDATMVGIPSQNGLDGCKEFRHAILPWRYHDLHLTTLLLGRNKGVGIRRVMN
jgi:hypothetical protein